MKKKKYIVISLIALVTSILGITLAKYITEDYHGYYINAKDFTFTSKILSPTGQIPYHIIDNWSGVGAFDVTIDLSTKKNNLYFTDYDVPYIVNFSCPDDAVCSLDKSSGVIYASDLTHTDTVTLHVQPLRTFKEGETLIFSVSARSTYPYEKALNMTFCYLVAQSSLSYTVTDDNPVYVKLAITNAINYCVVNTDFGNYVTGDRIDIVDYQNLTPTEKEKCTGTIVEIEFNPNDLLIDTTDNIITSNNYVTTLINNTPYINKITTELEPASAIDIKFYKTDPTALYEYPSNDPNAITDAISISVNR